MIKNGTGLHSQTSCSTELVRWQNEAAHLAKLHWSIRTRHKRTVMGDTRGLYATHSHKYQPAKESAQSVDSWRSCSSALPVSSALGAVLCVTRGGGGKHRKCSNADGQRATCLHGLIKQAFSWGHSCCLNTHTHTQLRSWTGLPRTPGLCKPRLFPELQGWRVTGDRRSCFSLTRTNNRWPVSSPSPGSFRGITDAFISSSLHHDSTLVHADVKRPEQHLPGLGLRSYVWPWQHHHYDLIVMSAVHQYHKDQNKIDLLYACT